MILLDGSGHRSPDADPVAPHDHRLLRPPLDPPVRLQGPFLAPFAGVSRLRVPLFKVRRVVASVARNNRALPRFGQNLELVREGSSDYPRFGLHGAEAQSASGENFPVGLVVGTVD